MIKLSMHSQPDDETCGPTSLHAVYKYFGDDITLEEVIEDVMKVKTGGTIIPYLGLHALNRGYNAIVYAYNINLFDLSWFHQKLKPNEIIAKLKLQQKYKKSKRFKEATQAYIKFMTMGGELCHKELTISLLSNYFKKGIPVLTGLSATYLYQSTREYQNRTGKAIYDDIRGEPCGHFVVLCGYDKDSSNIIVTDPHRENPISKTNEYTVSKTRLKNSIMLGVLTYDGNLLMVYPKKYGN